MNVVIKLTLWQRSPDTILQRIVPIILLNSNIFPVRAHRMNPRNMSSRPRIRLRNTSRLRRAINLDTGCSGSFIPCIRITPTVPLVPVGKVNVQPTIDAPCNERCALARVVVPLVDSSALAFVGVVVFEGARNGTALEVGSGAWVDDGVIGGDVAGVRGFGPD